MLNVVMLSAMALFSIKRIKKHLAISHKFLVVSFVDVMLSVLMLSIMGLFSIIRIETLSIKKT